MRPLILHGVLADPDLARLVLGGEVRVAPLTLDGCRLVDEGPGRPPGLEPAEGTAAPAGLVEASDAQAGRLAFYAAVHGWTAAELEAGQAFMSGSGRETWRAGAQTAEGLASLHAAAAVIQQEHGRRCAEEVRARLPQILIRAFSQARARATAPVRNVRRAFGRDDVTVQRSARPYLDFFTLDEQDLSFRHFRGGVSRTVRRAGFVSGDAVTVLPYDPARDRVYVIEQFRYGPFIRGDACPWSLEPVAGRIDPGETPEQAARRETAEEAGLTLRTLIALPPHYPSPGAVSEYIYPYVATADLPDDSAIVAGEEAEAEDIRGILLDLAQLDELVRSGEAETGPLLLSALWLQLNRDRLRDA